MKNRLRPLGSAVLMVCAASFTPARAQIPVTDIGAIAQLIAQVAKMEDQLLTARNQLIEARNTVEAMTGNRGMEQLLGQQVRNYLPSDWSSLSDVINNSASAYGGLAASLQSIVAGNAVLSPAQLSRLGSGEQLTLAETRVSAATNGAIGRSALADTSARFSDLQQLITAIGSASDQKAILDLQARIVAEHTMISNDQTKLQALYRTMDAEEQLRRQRVSERAIADTGNLRSLPAMGL